MKFASVTYSSSSIGAPLTGTLFAPAGLESMTGGGALRAWVVALPCNAGAARARLEVMESSSLRDRASKGKCFSAAFSPCLARCGSAAPFLTRPGSFVLGEPAAGADEVSLIAPPGRTGTEELRVEKSLAQGVDSWLQEALSSTLRCGARGERRGVVCRDSTRTSSAFFAGASGETVGHIVLRQGGRRCGSGGKGHNAACLNQRSNKSVERRRLEYGVSHFHWQMHLFGKV